MILQEIKELRESVSKSYNDQLNELNESLELTKKELTEVNKSSAERKHAIEDLNERLSAALQSCNEANEIVKRYIAVGWGSSLDLIGVFKD